MLGNSNGPDAGTAATVRDAEGLVQVQVRDIAAEFARFGEADQGIQVRAIDVDLAAASVHRVANHADVVVVNAVRGGVGNHDRGQRGRMLLDFRGQVLVVDRSVLGGGDDDDLHASEHGRGRVGSVGRRRDQADLALTFSAGLVVAADRQ